MLLHAINGSGLRTVSHRKQSNTSNSSPKLKQVQRIFFSIFGKNKFLHFLDFKKCFPPAC